jgi:hypothetical protein
MMAAVAPPPPPFPDGGLPSYSHAVSRSSELLSCAKTALKIAKSQHANDDDYGGTMWWACQQPNDLALSTWKENGAAAASTSDLAGLCEDGLSLLRTMDAELTQLEALVRRRGHTNDPTEEIAASVRRLETDAKELSSLVKTVFAAPGRSAHYQRHTQLIASWLESVASQQTAKLKAILKVRGNVLADQAIRRKLLNPQGPGGSGAHDDNPQKQHPAQTIRNENKKPAVAKAMATPLFTMDPLPKPPRASAATATTTAISTNGTTSSSTTAAGVRNGTNSAPTSHSMTLSLAVSPSTAPAYGRTSGNASPYITGAAASTTGAYGGAAAAGTGYYGGGGYGGGSAGGYGGATMIGSTGMRQRRPKATSAYHNNSNNLNNNNQQEDEAAAIQAQIQMRQQQRQTESRLQEAQQAERTLAELGTMFSKMTNLITQQGEVLENIEDDVEAGLDMVTQGQQEITNLYALKKGNRGLIIKLFSLLIFLIIFMRFYKK